MIELPGKSDKTRPLNEEEENRRWLGRYRKAMSDHTYFILQAIGEVELIGQSDLVTYETNKQTRKQVELINTLRSHNISYAVSDQLFKYPGHQRFNVYNPNHPKLNDYTHFLECAYIAKLSLNNSIETLINDDIISGAYSEVTQEVIKFRNENSPWIDKTFQGEFNTHNAMLKIIADSTNTIYNIYTILAYHSPDIKSMVVNLESLTSKNGNRPSVFQRLAIANNGFWPEMSYSGIAPDFLILEEEGYRIKENFNKLLSNTTRGGCPVAQMDIINEFAQKFNELLMKA